MVRSVYAWTISLVLLAFIIGFWPRPGFYPGSFGPDQQPASKTLRVMLLPHEGSVSRLSPFGPGFEKELVREFARRKGYEVKFSLADNPTHAWNALDLGRVDLALGLSHEPPASLDSPVAAGPAYFSHSPLLVGAARLAREAEIIPVSLIIPAAPWQGDELGGFDQLPGTSVEQSGDHRLEPVLDLLRYEKRSLALVDEARFKLWQPFYPGIRPQESSLAPCAQSVDQGDDRGETWAYRWFWRTGDQELEADLSAFWREPATTAYLEALQERYFGFLPEETDYFELDHLLDAVETELPSHEAAIAREAVNYRIDPLLLTAVIYQESRFDPQATSRTGVRGLMQITRSTARMLKVRDRLDPDESIRGGAQYLKELWDDLEEYNLEPTERWLFTLAAYNQGPGHLRDAIRLAKKLGGTGRTWKELKQAYPRLPRGGQAVAYVDKVRYYYYVLNGIVVLGRPEAQDLAPLELARGVFGSGPFRLASFGNL